VKRLDSKKIKSLIIEELNYLIECGCKDEVEDPRTLIPSFSSQDHSTHPQIEMITDYELDREDQALNAKCPGSYAKTADQLVLNPEFVAAVINILMKKSGSTCPQSSAKALNDIALLYNM
jgi:hypothetical protein